MRGVWGSLICVLFIALGIMPAQADEYAPLPIVMDDEYSPPAVFNNCEVAIAGNNVTTVASCLPRPGVTSKGDRFVFNDERRMELARVNAEFNAVLPDTAISIEEETQIAVGKMAYLLELGWPSMWLSYAIVETADDDELNHVVVLFRTLVLASTTDEIMPWQDSSYRFVGVETEGVWRPVTDDRHEPGSYYYDESYCGQHYCPIVTEE